MFERAGFDGNSVDIFVQTLQKISEKFLGVLLIVAHETRSKFLNLKTKSNVKFSFI